MTVYTNLRVDSVVCIPIINLLAYLFFWGSFQENDYKVCPGFSDILIAEEDWDWVTVGRSYILH